MPRILIVEDNPLSIEPLAECLELEAMEVLKASNGKEALKILETNEVDWVLTDIVMPDMDGIELLREFRNNYPLVQCIAWSGVQNSELYLRVASHLGAHRVLQKPIIPSDIIKIIRNES